MKREPLKYPIPHKYFPAVRVTKTFYAKIDYKIVAGKVVIEEITLDALCMEHMRNQHLFIREAKEVIQRTEDTIKRNNHVPNTIMASLAPFMPHL